MLILRQLLSLFLSFNLVFSPLYLQTAFGADLELDGSTNTTLDKARNGVDIVNIATPNSKGLSHNKFLKYNVDKRGQILNNSGATSVKTQLGGYIYGNKNLTSGSAKVILNEVTGSSRSYLRGYTEVAGKKADLVIANPNGISLNGAGFINVPNLTFTTGRPHLSGGNLNFFDVERGQIKIEGEGLDAKAQRSTRIYSRYLQLNAKIYANNLQIGLGSNRADYQTGQLNRTSPTDKGHPQLLLDSSQLGGIYASRITLVGTEKGVGVNLPPEVLASMGGITITNDGQIRLQKTESKKDLQVEATTGNIELDNTVYSGGEIKLRAKENATIRQKMESKKDLQVEAITGSIELSSGVYSSEGAKLKAKESVNIHTDIILSARNKVELTARKLLNKGVVLAGVDKAGTLNKTGELEINTKEVLNQKELQSTGTLNINTTDLNNRGSSILARDLTVKTARLDNSSGQIKTSNDLQIEAKKIKLNNSDIYSQHDLRLTLEELDNLQSSKMAAGHDLEIEAKKQLTNRSNLLANGSVSLKTGGTLINHGVISSQKNLTLKSDSLTNHKTISGGVGISKITTAKGITNNSRISSVHDLTVKGKDITNQGFFSSGHDLSISSRNLTNKSTIFGGNNASLYTTNNLKNEEGANILTVKKLKLAADDKNNKTASIINEKATIQTLDGDLDIYARTLQNTTDDPQIGTNHSGGWSDESSTQYLAHRSKEAELLSGGDLNLHIDRLTNHYSLISAAGNIDFKVGSLTNANLDLIRTRTVRWHEKVKDGEKCKTLFGMGWSKYHCRDTFKTVTRSSPSRSRVGTVSSTIQAGRNIDGIADKLQNGIKEGTTIPASTNGPQVDTSTTQAELRETVITPPQGQYGLFITAKDPSSRYLIETNPEFTLYKNFISSDYMMKHIKLSPEITTRRVGDAFYESKLIRESIFKQTGRKFLNKDLKSDNDQFRYLMDNALKAQRDLELVAGVKLTKAQINALTKDLVWMEEQVVAGQRVLVPVVYIAKLDNYKIHGGAIVAGDEIKLQVAQLQNSGSFEAGSNLSVEAKDTVENYGGNLSAGNHLSLKAKNDITNTSGTIQGGSVALNSTEGNIVNRRFAQEVDYGKGSTVDRKTLIGSAGVIKATSGDLDLTAQKGTVKIVGSNLEAKEGIGIKAKSFLATTTVDRREFFAGDEDNYIAEGSTTHLASNINAGKIKIDTTGATTIQGSNLKAAKALQIAASKVDILAVNNSSYSRSKSTSKRFLKSTTKTDQHFSSRNVSSNLSGGQISLTSRKKDITIVGSNLQAKDDLELESAGDVNILAGYNTDHEDHTETTTKRFSGGSMMRATMDNNGSYDKNAVTSNLGGSNIRIKSKTLNVVGSKVEAKNNLKVESESVNIMATKEVHRNWESHKEIDLSYQDALQGMSSAGTNSKSMMKLHVSYSDTKESDGRVSNKASNLKAGEELSLKANTGDINIQGSNLESGGDMELEAEGQVNILAAYDQKNHSTQETSGEIDLNVKSNFSTETKIDLEMVDEGNGSKLAKKSSLSSGGKLKIKSHGDTNIIGADLTSAGDTDIEAGGNLQIAEAQDEHSQYKDNTSLNSETGGKSGIKIGEGQLEVEMGHATIKQIKSKTSQSKVNSSNLQAGGSLTLKSQKDIVVQGSNISARDDLNLEAAGDVTIKEAKEVEKESTNTKEGKAEVNLVVKNEYAKAAYAIKAVNDAKEALSKTKRDYSDYKKELSKQKDKLSQLKEDLRNKKLGIEQADIDEFEELVADLEEDDNFYKTNVALATTAVATAVTAAVAQAAKAASSSGTYGFNVGLDIKLDATEKQLDTYKERSVASSLSGSNIRIKSGKKGTIQGSNLKAAGEIEIDTKELEILASSDRASSSSSEEHTSATISIDVYGGGVSGNLSADRAKTLNDNTTNTNSSLQAGNIKIKTQEKTTIKGANLKAKENLKLSTKELEIASVQDTSRSKRKSAGFSVGGGGGSVSSVGANQSASNGRTKQTIQTSLLGGKVEIEVENGTSLKGATVAAVDAQGKDNGQLSLKTKTLRVSSLNNTRNSSSKSSNVSAGSTASVGYSADNSNSKSKVLGTLGQGKVEIAEKQNSDTRLLNRDIEDNEIDIYQISSHKGLKGSLDTNLLTKKGRAKIAEDILKSKMFYDVTKQIVTTKRAGILDFNHELGRLNNTYEAIKRAIQQDEKLAKALTNPDLTLEEKQLMMGELVNATLAKLEYKEKKVKVIAQVKESGEKHKGDYGEDGNIYVNNTKNSSNKDLMESDDERRGHYGEDGNIYVNDTKNNSNKDLVETAGHEASHAMDDEDNINISSNKEDNETYAKNYGGNFKNYTDFAGSNYGLGGLSNKPNRHTGNSTSKLIQQNNQDYDKLDKSKGRNFLTKKEEQIKNNINDQIKHAKTGTNKNDFIKQNLLLAIKKLNILDKKRDKQFNDILKTCSSEYDCGVKIAKLFGDVNFNTENGAVELTILLESRGYLNARNFDNKQGSHIDQNTGNVVYKNGTQDPGGASYGPIQLASNGRRGMSSFLNNLKSNPSEKAKAYYRKIQQAGGLKGAKEGSDEFKKAWEELSKDPQFIQYQLEETVKNYNVVKNRLKKDGVNLSNQSRGLQEVIAAETNQKGKNSVYGPGNGGNYRTNKANKEQIRNAIYEIMDREDGYADMEEAQSKAEKTAKDAEKTRADAEKTAKEIAITYINRLESGTSKQELTELKNELNQANNQATQANNQLKQAQENYINTSDKVKEYLQEAFAKPIQTSEEKKFIEKAITEALIENSGYGRALEMKKYLKELKSRTHKTE